MTRLVWTVLVGLISTAGPRLSAQSITRTDVQLVTSQLGFRPDSPKTLTFWARNVREKLPDQIPFYIQPIGGRRNRQKADAALWKDSPFRNPIDLAEGRYADNVRAYGNGVYQGVLKKLTSAWGTYWQADFSDFRQEGHYQIECEYGFTTPFVIETGVYDRLVKSYLNYLYHQRSGQEIPGFRPALHTDDGKLDTDGTYVPAAGGWYDAGDFRKWMALTQPNIQALRVIAQAGHPGFRQRALDEIRWGNTYFQHMISPEGMVYEDVDGGKLRPGYTYEQGWWVENHPGCIATNCQNVSDNIPNTGDERPIRVHYNPLVQYMFVRQQGHAYQALTGNDRGACVALAERAWRYGQAHNSDRRTLFVAEELLAALELRRMGSKLVGIDRLTALATELLARQDRGTEGLSGYFLEEGGTDGYRSIAYAAEPPLALLTLVADNPPGPEGPGLEGPGTGLDNVVRPAQEAVMRYIEQYVLADARSNPFGYPPYGVYLNPPLPDRQRFREAGRGRGVRSFVHLYGERQMPHGTSSVVMQQAYLLAWAGKQFGRPDYRQAAERLLQWATGHNPAGLCLTTGVGFRHPVPANFVWYGVPDAFVVGFLGRPDDTPYLETSNAVEWSTQEIWDVPFYYAVLASHALRD